LSVVFNEKMLDKKVPEVENILKWRGLFRR
jgi:hypothetical protein